MRRRLALRLCWVLRLRWIWRLIWRRRRSRTVERRRLRRIRQLVWSYRLRARTSRYQQSSGYQKKNPHSAVIKEAFA